MRVIAQPEGKLAELLAVLQRQRPGNMRALRACVEALAFSKADIAPYAEQPLPPKADYGRSIIHASAELEVIIATWPAGNWSAIHDHGPTEFGVVLPLGPVAHRVYAWRDGALLPVRSETAVAGTLLPVGRSLIHQMGNDGTETVFTLHVYLRDKDADEEGVRVFDLENGRILRATGGAFFDLPEKEILEIAPGPQLSSHISEKS